MAFFFWRRPRLDGQVIADSNEFTVGRPLPPFKPDSDFVPPRGGSAVVSILKRARSKSGSRVALVGPAGVGKSQLAIEYCCQADEVFRLPLVFWIGAETRERFLGDLRSIADLLDIRDYGTTEPGVPQRVAQWLLNPSNGPWFLVLDGVTKADVLSCSDGEPTTLGNDSGARRRDFLHLLSNVSHGSILVTTTDKDTALALGIKSSDIVPVRAMSAGPAVKLLLKKLGDHDQHSKQDDMELVKTLEYNPLAIVQAAAYISRHTLPISVNAYLQERKRNKTSIRALFQEQSHQFRRDCSASDYIKACWRPVIEFLKPSCKDLTPAAALLSFMSFFDRDHIPKSLAESRRSGADESVVTESDQGHQSDLQTDEPPPLGDGSNQYFTDASERDVQDLLDAGLIAKGNPGVFSMHQLVQLAVRHWLKDNRHFEYFESQFICWMGRNFPTGRYENWDTCRRLYPHVQEMTRHRPTDAELLGKQAQVLCHASLYQYQLEMGYPDQAIDVLQQARETSLDQNHPDILAIECELATVYRDRGRLQTAEGQFSKLLSVCTEILGGDHPLTLNCKANLVTTYLHLKECAQAEDLGVEVVNLRQSRLGKEHADTLRSELNLASAYYLQNMWEDARKLQVHVVETSKQKSKISDLIGDSMEDLAITENYMGRKTSAVRLLQGSITVRSMQPGSKKEDIIWARNILSEWRRQLLESGRQRPQRKRAGHPRGRSRRIRLRKEKNPSVP
ncbi:uncharacterized protein B0I36DRAFT_255978 [Microdochium trichocladiopsis]|uniref:P-loop containing nucleoside triphosphate hydrolase protein n=1 Tax=Microdochium trichocladiopsis TaxID=1682393 RepID=A0A9P8XU29_9PEZI|nr:uncharacterized protein B0I36DRAFT_255978 [Microdochium trichocladiopsis]KAH7012455.1 hypothetical protein B0I36DRAFT_255978 [Microdochium trichocladiopsis]